MAEIPMYERETIESVSRVIATLLENETDYDHIKPLLDAWADLHDRYGSVWFPNPNHTLQRDVVTCLAFLNEVDELERREYVQESIEMAIDPRLGSSPLPQFELEDSFEEIEQKELE